MEIPKFKDSGYPFGVFKLFQSEEKNAYSRGDKLQGSEEVINDIDHRPPEISGLGIVGYNRIFPETPVSSVNKTAERGAKPHKTRKVCDISKIQ
jgi:hypothetical protein